MDSQDLSLNPEWRARLKEIGRTNFVREEMLRLGFYTHLPPEERARLQAVLDDAYPKLAELKRDLAEIRAQIQGVTDVEALLKEVRRARIERVRQEREEKKASKIVEQEQRRLAHREFKRTTPPFLGVGVSSRLVFEGGSEDSLVGKGLPVPTNIEELAGLMAISEGDLQWLSYERAAASVDHYTRFEIPKRTGGKRLISSPKPLLRAAQQWIDRSILKRMTPSPYATAFRTGMSIIDNAAPHMNASVVVRLDLKDFFPSISFRRVRGFFEQLGYNPGIATVLSLLCTDAPRLRVDMDGRTQYVAMGDRSLPQGACTSPALANLIAGRLDARLAGLGASLENAWTYTRYADDLTFSSRADNPNVGRLLKAVERLVHDEGFELNPQKTAVMRAPGRQVVTGLLVGDSIRLSRRDLKRFRAFLHRCQRDGLERVSLEMGRDALSVARGYFAYLAMVMPDLGEKLRRSYAWL